MLSRNHVAKSFAIVFGALLLNISLGNFFGAVRAQESQQEIKEGLPLRRVGGGSRGDGCTFNKNRLTAVMPKNSLARTSEASPKLFFYIPAIEEPRTVEFVVRDGNDNLVYETTRMTNGRSGIISLDIPVSQKSNSLKTNQDYHWYVSLICDSGDRDRDVVVEGFVRRVELDPTLAKKLEGATPMEQLVLYQEAELWHEYLGTLAELKLAHPKDPVILDKWNELFASVELDAIAQEPLIGNR